jgi:RimJ/RimL family protein N-acetyltransferase
MILKTRRLTLRLLTTSDAAFIFELVNQPSWLKNIGDRNVHSLEDAVGYIEKGPLTSYHRFGFGLWCVERTEDHTPIGMCGLLQRDYLDSPDIGFAYLERFQGQGYGMEAATATLEYALSTLRLDRMAAVVSPDNTGSIRILQRLGMRYVEPILMPGDTEPIALYRLPGR